RQALAVLLELRHDLVGRNRHGDHLAPFFGPADRVHLHALRRRFLQHAHVLIDLFGVRQPAGRAGDVAAHRLRRRNRLRLGQVVDDALQALARELEGAGVRAHAIASDLAAPGAVAALAERVRQLGLEVDILVNNAGYGTFGRFAETPLDGELAMIQVNIVALTELTKRLLPPMIARGRGRILNLASTAAF